MSLVQITESDLLQSVSVGKMLEIIQVLNDGVGINASLSVKEGRLYSNTEMDVLMHVQFLDNFEATILMSSLKSKNAPFVFKMLLKDLNDRGYCVYVTTNIHRMSLLLGKIGGHLRGACGEFVLFCFESRISKEKRYGNY